jgi:Rrf2 family protein
MLTDLARQGGETVTLKSIGERQEVSVNYLEQVAKDLKRAGYVGSIKGPQGGYFLARKPGEVNVGDALRALEGDVRLTERKKNEDESLLRQCVRECVYDPLNATLAELFDSLTLEDIIKGDKL